MSFRRKSLPDTDNFISVRLSEYLNAIEIDLHRDISDFRFSHIINDYKMLQLLVLQQIKAYFVLSF